jgi:hypothetical protein
MNEDGWGTEIFVFLGISKQKTAGSGCVRIRVWTCEAHPWLPSLLGAMQKHRFRRQSFHEDKANIESYR